MNRAAVLIGVEKTGGFPRLQAVTDGVRRMEQWAGDQGITNITKLTDENGPVSAQDISKVVKDLVDALTVEQLIIYFTGHGLNLGRSEFWLLSGFPDDTTGAVNVAASVEQARTCTIPHVIFISDACRTPAKTLQQQMAAMDALKIFPNMQLPGSFKWADIFYGTRLGDPALEVQDETGRFHGVYTEALIDALNGTPPIIPEPDTTTGKNLIRPWPLKKHLTSHVPLRLRQFQPPPQQTQVPDAVLSSDPTTAWVSALDLTSTGSPLRGGGSGGSLGGGSEPSLESTGSPPDEPATSLQDLSRAALHRALEADDADIGTLTASASGGRPGGLMRGGGGGGLSLEGRGSGGSQASELFESTAATAATAFGRTQFESKCGFKVRGVAIREAFSTDARVEVIDAGWEACRVWLKDGHNFANVLLSFDNGKSVVLPAINDFIAGLTFDENGALIDIGYEPSENSDRWPQFQARQDKLRGLRAVIAASTRMGTFQLEGENDAESVARDMQVEKGIDPSLGIYAAYAYRRQGNQRRLQQIYRFMGNDLGMVFYDIALLAGELRGGGGPSILPPAPLLTQGWALLSAFDVPLPPELDEIRQHIDFDSLWTLYDAAGAQRLRDFLAAKGG